MRAKKRIDKLTPEQEAMLVEKRNEWLAVGLSTEPADRERFAAGLKLAYAQAGKPAPKFIIWLPSWRACNYAASVVLPAIFGELGEVDRQVEERVWKQVEEKVKAQYRGQVEAKIGGQAWERAWEKAVGYVEDQVLGQVAAQVMEEAEGRTRDKAWVQARTHIREQVAKQSAKQSARQVRGRAWAHIRVRAEAQDREEVLAQVWSRFEAQVEERARDQVGGRARAQIREKVGGQVREQVEEQVREQVVRQPEEVVIWPWFWNSFNAGWMSCYSVMGDLGVDVSKLDGLMEMARSAGPSWLWWDVALVCDRPLAIHRNTNGLHRDGGMAVEYRDGWGVHALNGVRVPEWLAMTPAEDLAPALFATIENVEVRREFIRKVGVERLCQKLGTEVLDRSADGMYELHLVDLKGTTGKHPYLKMRNPSIGVYHMEAVEKSCRTVRAALAFRNGGEFEHIAPLT